MLLARLATLAAGAAAPAASAENPGAAPIVGPIDKADILGRNLAKIKLPPGFTITLYAIVPGARTIAVGPKGKMLFVGTQGAKVFALPVRPGPERVRIFSAQHGSWNRAVPIGARIMFTSLKPDGTADRTEAFAEGWCEPDGSYWGRPVDVAQLPDGSILMSDDYNGALYRIAYKGR